jgi:hypothetical protein
MKEPSNDVVLESFTILRIVSEARSVAPGPVPIRQWVDRVTTSRTEVH